MRTVVSNPKNYVHYRYAYTVYNISLCNAKLHGFWLVYKSVLFKNTDGIRGLYILFSNNIIIGFKIEKKKQNNDGDTFLVVITQGK